MTREDSSRWRTVSPKRGDGPFCCCAPCGLRVYEIRIPNPDLAGKRILFASDFHLRSRAALSLPQIHFWRGIDWIRTSLFRAVDLLKPDFFIFGGDLVSESAWIDDGLKLLKDLNVPNKIAIPGNWELRRKWQPAKSWRRWFESAGMTFLQNEGISMNGIYFYGLDDFKKGDPELTGHSKSEAFACLLAHNPDAVTLLPKTVLEHTQLILCGHTHGGQVRIPGFGAVKSSTAVWKRFERGMYIDPETETKMFVSAGIGVTWLRIRIFCPPEIACVTFV